MKTAYEEWRSHHHGLICWRHNQGALQNRGLRYGGLACHGHALQLHALRAPCSDITPYSGLQSPKQGGLIFSLRYRASLDWILDTLVDGINSEKESSS